MEIKINGNNVTGIDNMEKQGLRELRSKIYGLLNSAIKIDQKIPDRMNIKHETRKLVRELDNWWEIIDNKINKEVTP